MRNILFRMAIIFLCFISFSYSQQIMELHSNGLTYKKGSTVPYNGPIITYYSNGNKRALITFKQGKLEGLRIGWYKNGQKSYQYYISKGDKKDGIDRSWYENGKIHKEIIYHDDKVLSLNEWDENGKEVATDNIFISHFVKILTSI